MVLVGQKSRTVQSKAHCQKLNSASIYFQTAILPQGAVYAYIFFERNCMSELVLVCTTNKRLEDLEIILTQMFLYIQCGQNVEDIELQVEFSRNPFYSWCFQCYADGLEQTDRLSDAFVIYFFFLVKC